nr:Ycf68 protein [Murraya koenigii]BEV77061.1 Ycf68 protein [Murraya koenigii]
MAYFSCSNRGFENKPLLRRIDGAIQVRSNVDPTFYSLVGSGRSGGDHHGSSLLDNPYIPYQCMDSYLSSTGLGSASMGKKWST